MSFVARSLSLRSGCSGSSCLLQQLLHLGDVVRHCFLLGFCFHSLPSIPFGLAGHVKEAGTGGVDGADGGLLEEAIEAQLVFVGR